MKSKEEQKAEKKAALKEIEGRALVLHNRMNKLSVFLGRSRDINSIIKGAFLLNILNENLNRLSFQYSLIKYQPIRNKE